MSHTTYGMSHTLLTGVTCPKSKPPVKPVISRPFQLKSSGFFWFNREFSRRLRLKSSDYSSSGFPPGTSRSVSLVKLRFFPVSVSPTSTGNFPVGFDWNTPVFPVSGFPDYTGIFSGGSGWKALVEKFRFSHPCVYHSFRANRNTE